MNESLFDILSEIDPKFIEEAAEIYSVSRRRPSKKAVLSAVAAAALAVAIVPTALLVSKKNTIADEPPAIDTPTDPPTSDDPPETDDPPTPGESDPPAAGSPMSLGETRTLPSGTEVSYLAKTDHSLTIFVKKADADPVYMRLAGSNGSKMYYASTYPNYAGQGERVQDGLTLTVDGEKGGFPSAPGEYTVVIDYAPMKEKCRSLDFLYTSLGAFFL